MLAQSRIELPNTALRPLGRAALAWHETHLAGDVATYVLALPAFSTVASSVRVRVCAAVYRVAFHVSPRTAAYLLRAAFVPTKFPR